MTMTTDDFISAIHRTGAEARLLPDDVVEVYADEITYQIPAREFDLFIAWDDLTRWRAAPADFTDVERMHWDHAGWSYRTGEETPFEGRVRCAREAAADEARLRRYVAAGLMVVHVTEDEWPREGDADPEVYADMIEGLESGRYDYIATEIATADGFTLAHLGGSCVQSDETTLDADGIPLYGYPRTVVVELFSEAMDALRQREGWQTPTGEPSDVVPCTCADQARSPEWATCGTCGYVWCARCHPVPGARTPCEYEHVYPDPTARSRHVAAVANLTAALDALEDAWDESTHDEPVNHLYPFTESLDEVASRASTYLAALKDPDAWADDAAKAAARPSAGDHATKLRALARQLREAPADDCPTFAIAECLDEIAGGL